MVAHGPFALGVAHALRQARLVTAAAWVPWALTFLLVAALRGRIRLAQWDRPIGALRSLLVEEPYYAHWFAVILSVPLYMLVAVGLTAWRLATANSPPWGAMALGTYAFSLAV